MKIIAPKQLMENQAPVMRNGGVFSRASLDLQFARTRTLDSRITFSRASSGTYVDAAGVIRTAGNNVARFDHDPTTGESLGLLVEESRTNLLTYSEDFSQSVYTHSNVSASSYAENAPDGSQTAALFLEAAASGGHFVFNNVVQSTTQGTTSVWIKPLGRSFMSFRQYYTTDNWVVAVFDVTGNGAVTDIQYGTSTGYTGVSAGIKSYPNGWYRISVTSSNSGGLDLPLVIHTNTSGTPTLNNNGDELFAGDTAKGFYIWGAQLEAGSFPTSYIRTEGSTATRSADVASITGTNFSSWYNQTEGTVFAESERPDASRPNTVVVSISDGTSSNRIESRSSSGTIDNARCEIVTLGAGQYSNASLTSDTAYKKIALAYAANNVNAAANGNAGILDTTATIPAVSQLYLGNDLFLTDYRPGRIKRLTYWSTRLSNDTLQTITQ